ncbi:MAG TPA: tetratricopeptide repeat protein, partial [Abditibacteriaceae bacterium]
MIASPQSIPETPVRRPARRNTQRPVLSIIAALLFIVVIRVLLIPDPAGGLLFARAQRLEEAGLMKPALRQYELLANTHPNSPYAPRALQREADLLTELAREGETANYALAIATYDRLAQAYPQSPLAGEALLSIGAIYFADLNDAVKARAAYEQALKNYANNREFASEATLRIGRLYLASRDGKNAQTWLQRVLQKYNSFPERAAEAQFHLGETYESLFKNREWARNAYETTLKNYAQTVWAGKAKERLGLMIYGEAAPRARRVLIEVPPATDEKEDSRDELLSSLTPLFAARGMNVGEGVLRGWGLEPFYAGYFPNDPGRVARAPFEAWENAVANAGLRYTIADDGDDKTALKALQDELDDAHLSLVYNGEWRVAVGYDSAENLVYLQRGARLEKVNAVDFAKRWNRRSALGGAFTLVSFQASGEDARALPKIAPVTASRVKDVAQQPIAGAAPKGNDRANLITYAQIAAQQSPLATPTYLYTLKPLDEREAHKNTVRRARDWMRRGRSGEAVLNTEALRTLSAELKQLAQSIEPARDEASPDIDTPSDLPTPVPTPPDEALAREELNDPNASVAGTPQPSATPTPVVTSAPVR